MYENLLLSLSYCTTLVLMQSHCLKARRSFGTLPSNRSPLQTKVVTFQPSSSPIVSNKSMF